MPIVDGIDWNTMEYAPVYGKVLHRGIFEWGFFYKETAVPEKELRKRKYNSEPYWYAFFQIVLHRYICMYKYIIC